MRSLLARTCLSVSVAVSLAASLSVGAALAGAGTPASASPAGPAVWHPAPGVTWQWQLEGRIDTTVAAQVYDVDGADTPASTVRKLHAQGRRVVCYFSAGSFEDWRDDAGAFPAAVKGRSLDGWAGERWLDVRRLDVLLPIMARRMDACAAKGFDAVEPDNVDAYQQSTGFPLTAAQQLTYNRAVADLAHRRGLAVALKNDVDQVRALEPAFDFAVNEECFAYSECGAYRPFVRAGKAVLNAEYAKKPATICRTTAKLGLSTLRKHRDLGAWRQTCPR